MALSAALCGALGGAGMCSLSMPTRPHPPWVTSPSMATCSPARRPRPGPAPRSRQAPRGHFLSQTGSSHFSGKSSFLGAANGFWRSRFGWWELVATSLSLFPSSARPQIYEVHAVLRKGWVLCFTSLPTARPRCSVAARARQAQVSRVAP